MSTLSLYEVVTEFRAIAKQLEEMDLDERTLHDTLEGVSFPVEQKARSVAMVVANLQATAEAYSSHAKQAAEKAASIQKRAEWLKIYLLENMQACGISEITGQGITLKIKNNPPAVEVYDEKLLPEKYLKTAPLPTPTPDKRALLESLKAGNQIPGARIVRKSRVDIS